ncbi:MAG: SWIM zinc finger family protein [Candidatus Bathyarchaeia archaeon]
MPRQRPRPSDPMYEKAVKLVASGRVEALGSGVYNVVGDHGTYTVAEDYTGKISCNCQGFLSKGRCSHAEAVSLLMRGKRRRTAR